MKSPKIYNRIKFVFIISFLLFISGIYFLERNEYSSNISTPKAAVESTTTIDGNAAIEAYSLKTGNGTFDTPYLIKDIVFNSTTGTNRLNLWNIDKFIQIKNCTFLNSALLPLNDGISAKNISHLMIENCTFYFNRYGLNITYSTDIMIENCTFYNNAFNIYTQNSANFNYTNNRILFSHSVSVTDKSSFYFENTSNGYILSNEIIESAIGLYFKGSFHNNIQIRLNTLINNSVNAILGINMTNLTIEGNHLHRNGYGGSTPPPSINLRNISHSSILNNNITGIKGILVEDNSLNTTIKSNYIVNATNDLYLDDYGIKISYSSNLTLENNKISGIQDHGIQLMNITSSNIRNNSISGNDRFGIYMNGSQYNTLEKNDIFAANRMGMYIYKCSDCIFTENHAWGNGLEESANYGGLALFYTNWSSIMKNNFSENIMNGIYSEKSNYNVYQENILNRNRNYGMWLYWEDNNNTIINNEISHTIGDSPFNYGSGLFIEDNMNSYIAGNQILNNSGMGIYLDTVENNTVSNNNISIGNYIGLYGEYVNDNEIKNNQIEQNRIHGIHLVDSQGNNIKKNKIKDNLRIGLYLEKDNENPNVNIIWENNLTGNIWSQALVNFPNNFDNGTIGNYWGDYTTKYPTATYTNMIWNTPYQINGSSTVFDNFPIRIDEANSPNTISNQTNTNTNTPSSTSTNSQTNPPTNSSQTSNSSNIPYIPSLLPYTRISGIPGYPLIIMLGISAMMVWILMKKSNFH